jgi:hypothetical protein
MIIRHLGDVCPAKWNSGWVGCARNEKRFTAWPLVLALWRYWACGGGAGGEQRQSKRPPLAKGAKDGAAETKELSNRGGVIKTHGQQPRKSQKLGRGIGLGDEGAADAQAAAFGFGGVHLF